MWFNKKISQKYFSVCTTEEFFFFVGWARVSSRRGDGLAATTRGLFWRENHPLFWRQNVPWEASVSLSKSSPLLDEPLEPPPVDLGDRSSLSNLNWGSQYPERFQVPGFSVTNVPVRLESGLIIAFPACRRNNIFYRRYFLW